MSTEDMGVVYSNVNPVSSIGIAIEHQIFTCQHYSLFSDKDIMLQLFSSHVMRSLQVNRFLHLGT